MQLWDADYYDMDGPAHLVLEAVPGAGDAATGRFAFGLIRGEIDGRCEIVDGDPLMRFCWVGEDEGDPMSGRGWLSVTPTQLRGQIFIQFGDDSTFEACAFTRTRA